MQIEDRLTLDADVLFDEVVARLEPREADIDAPSLKRGGNTAPPLTDVSVYRHSISHSSLSVARGLSRKRNKGVPTLDARTAPSHFTWEFPPEGRELP